MFEPINLSAFADPLLDELVSGEPNIDGAVFWQTVSRAGGPILELGCGYGRITIPLAQRGIPDLTGIELSAPSLAAARAKASTLPIQWIEADVRDFHLGQTYALIFARGNVINFMLTRHDQEAMLTCVREHLADNGQFLFDVVEKPPSQFVTNVNETAWFTIQHSSGRHIVVSGTDQFDFARQLWTQTCYERWDTPDGELIRPPWSLTLRYTMPQECESLLHYNGFRIVAKYADYDGAPETAEQPASVYVCMKR